MSQNLNALDPGARLDPLISVHLRNELRSALATLSTGVTLDLRVRGCADDVLPDTQRAVRSLAQAVADAAPERVTLRVTDPDDGATTSAGEEDVPVLRIGVPGEESRIEYRGVPGGYELGAVVDAVQRLGTGSPGLTAASVAHIGALRNPATVMVFVTPTCPYCPMAAALAFRLAMASPRIRAVVVEAIEFPELADLHHVRGVPHIVVNGTASFTGSLPEDDFVMRVVELARWPEAA